MILFILCSVVLSVPPKIQTKTISEIYDIMYKPYGLNATTPTKAQLDWKPNPSIAFIVRDHGDMESGSGQTFYEVTGTPEEIAQFQAAASLMPQSNFTIEQLNSTNQIIFIQFKRSASYKQEAVFWVVIVTFIIFIGGVVSSLTLWHLDRYDLDPANSLLFVTEGNTIVAGTNDPK